MLAAAVDPGKGLFVEQTHQAMLSSNLLHDLHGQLVLIGGDVGGGIDGCQLVLCGGYLIMLRFGQDPQLPQLPVQLLHIGRHSGLDGAEVVVVQFLALGGLGTEQGPAGVDQVAALVIHILIDEEILLFCACGRKHALDAVVAEQLQDAQGLDVQRLHAAQQGRFLVQGLSSIRAEGGGDA